MKLDISFPVPGCQKLTEVGDAYNLCIFYVQRLVTEVAAGALGEEWKGYVVWIIGGNNKQGFPMRQGILTHGRMCLLLSKGHSCHRLRGTGEWKPEFADALWMPIWVFSARLFFKEGGKVIHKLTNAVPHGWGQKELFIDVLQYVVRKPLNEGKKPRTRVTRSIVLLFHTLCSVNGDIWSWRSHTPRQHKEEAAQYAKPLVKKMKETEVGKRPGTDHQETGYPGWELLLLSLNPGNKSNK